MKKSAIFCLFVLSATSAGAIDRLDASALKCDAVRDHLSTERQAILHYSRQKPQLYERVVSNNFSCDTGQINVGFQFQSFDAPDCTVGICRSYPGRGGR